MSRAASEAPRTRKKRNTNGKTSGSTMSTPAAHIHHGAFRPVLDWGGAASVAPTTLTAGSGPQALREIPDLRVVIKAGFGFGDVNACVVFRKWEP